MELQPNLSGYAAAMERKRRLLGHQVPFFIPGPVTWPSGIPTNSEGEPLDPTVQPTGSAMASASVTCEAVRDKITGTERTVRPRSEQEPVGWGEINQLVLLVGKTDYDEEGLEGATQCELFGHKFAIRDMIPDALTPGTPERMLIFIEKE